MVGCYFLGKELQELIENGYESNFLDFKTKMNSRKGTQILTLANSNHLGKNI